MKAFGTKSTLAKIGFACLSFTLLFSCSHLQEQKSRAAFKNDNGIIKSVNDQRQYRSVVLPNQLEVMLVSDPSIKKSAAALSVAAGSFQEPPEFGGLAHYLEHMLFLGTRTYPKQGEYSEFISKHGGTQNAYTQFDHTNYMVAVNNDAFDEALDRFSGFFYEPTLNKVYADKERNAVHSEWSQKGPNDGVILEQLDGITLNPKHPFAQFSWGNLDSLSDKKAGNKLHDALLKFYNQYYSANLMKAVIISPFSLAEMEAMAAKHFGRIKNKKVPRPTVKVPARDKKHLKKIIQYKPQADSKEIEIRFLIDNNIDKFKVKPNRFLTYLIGSESKGTLAWQLREQELIERIYAYHDAKAYGNAGSFTIYIRLSEKGLKNRDTIIGSTLKYLALLKERGVDEKYFKALQLSFGNKFRFQNKINDYSYAMQIAANLQTYPIQYVLSAPYEYQRFDSEAIHAVLKQLTLDNARIFYIDKGQSTDTKMENFAGQYRVTTISKTQEAKWKSIASKTQLTLPRPNRFMPENFDLKTAVFTDKPEALIREKGLNVFLGHSGTFKKPQGQIVVNFNTDYERHSARRQVASRLLASGLNNHLVSLRSDASFAGSSISTSISNGFVISSSGFTDKQPALIKEALNGILNYKPTEEALLNLKASFVADLNSKKQQVLINQLIGKLNKVLDSDSRSDESYLKAVASIQVKDLVVLRNQLLKRANLSVYAYGNFSREEIITSARHLASRLPRDRDLAPLFHSQYFVAKTGTVHNWQMESAMTDVAYGEFFFQPFNLKRQAASGILERIIEPALFHQLRTEEQLGYTVGYFNNRLNPNGFLQGFYLQSPAKGPAHIADRIDAFMSVFNKELEAKLKSDFDTVKQARLVSLTTPPKNIYEESLPYLTDWGLHNFNFDSKQKLVDATKNTSAKDVLDTYRELLSPQQLGHLTIQLRGSAFSKSDFAKMPGMKAVKDINSFHGHRQ